VLSSFVYGWRPGNWRRLGTHLITKAPILINRNLRIEIKSILSLWFFFCCCSLVFTNARRNVVVAVVLSRRRRNAERRDADGGSHSTFVRAD